MREPPGGWSAHDGLIIPIAARYYRALGGESSNPGAVEFEELMQQGRLGLIAATDRWDPERGAFSTVAVLWIRNAISRYVANHARLVRVPVNTLAKQHREGTLRREHFIRLDAPVGNDTEDHRTFAEFIPDPNAEDPIENIATEQDAAAVHAAIERLPPQQRLVLEARFFAGRTLQQIGTDLGRSRERIRQIESEGLEALRLMFRRSRRPARAA